eukprot:764923-Hanusia_phi.AAC.6
MQEWGYTLSSSKVEKLIKTHMDGRKLAPKHDCCAVLPSRHPTTAMWESVLSLLSITVCTDYPYDSQLQVNPPVLFRSNISTTHPYTGKIYRYYNLHTGTSQCYHPMDRTPTPPLLHLPLKASSEPQLQKAVDHPTHLLNTYYPHFPEDYPPLRHSAVVLDGTPTSESVGNYMTKKITLPQHYTGSDGVIDTTPIPDHPLSVKSHKGY